MLDDLNRELEGFVHLKREAEVLEIRMVKPKVNAICRRFSRAMERAALYLQHEPELRVGILSSGNDKAFSAGMDFLEGTLEGEGAREAGAREGGFGGITTLWSLKKPLIAAINAPAIGGGLELALSCDLLLMADEASFQLPELARGLLPDGGGLQRLPRRIPFHVATAMIWTGEPMTAAEARHWGLVYRTAPRAELMDLAWAVARKIGRGAPLAQQAFKESLRFVDAMPDREAMAMRGDSDADLVNFRRMLASQDMIEGQRAFLEKREPRWQGR
ncbi:enoyl-CoA hydratase-related protein [Tianweitania sediminis]|jgi:enoyl-CoA hydratase/carnithine racemase|uniref:Enoyl-CoA hydratase/isomerase family protein n=1 Tax=Tianweitania sediminis TaxID=1502156 RepID=A0A8J7R454_9HYPH|nr:enoyl-CoA hydratase-related protein [Tianweitania sediminis]MBP0437037.1 enoyl-CoA hydratase/isomerase family protein [Tianweitania sediminis]HEV7415428.1 enoyl-CoA hydratase-related protein [Tianweitania sediminis]